MQGVERVFFMQDSNRIEGKTGELLHLKARRSEFTFIFEFNLHFACKMGEDGVQCKCRRRMMQKTVGRTCENTKYCKDAVYTKGDGFNHEDFPALSARDGLFDTCD
jgi:hypothetical protein